MNDQNNCTDNIMSLSTNNDDSEDFRNIPVPHINKKQYEHNNLVKWLRLCCDNSNDAFKNQNYSDSYMDMFNITDIDEIFYQNGKPYRQEEVDMIKNMTRKKAKQLK